MLFSLNARADHDRGCEVYLQWAGLRAPERLVAGLVSVLPGTLPVLLNLDRKYRTGWINVGVPDPTGETVYRHTRRLVIAISSYAPHRPRAPVMGLVHDFPEDSVIDYTPFDGITAAAKYEEEDRAMVALTKSFGPSGAFILDLWREFEARQTREAMIVHQLDKLAGAVQALEYDRDGYDVEQFFESVLPHLEDVRLRQVWSAMLTYRKHPGVDYHQLYYALLRGERRP